MNGKPNRAEELLQNGATLVLIDGSGVLCYYDRGIKTLLSLQGKLEGAFAADKVIGKAAAMLFVRGKIGEVYAELISEPALEVFERHGVPCSYKKCVPNIINREGTGMCPMERAVLDVDDVEKAYEILIERTGGR